LERLSSILAELLNRPERLRWIELQEFGKLKKLNDVDTSLATFESGNKRLMFAQLLGEIGLGDSSRFALGGKQIDQGFMTR
jgi:hypothetical protein